MKKAVKIIAIIGSIGLIANLIILGIGLSNKVITWGVFLTSILSDIFTVILLWSLHYALEKIEMLEDKIELNKREIAKHKKIHIENLKDIYICGECGCELYPEEEVCPRCRTPREE